LVWVLALLLVALTLAAAGLLIVTLQVLLLIFAGVLFGIFLHQISRLLCDRTRLSYRGAYLVLTVLPSALTVFVQLLMGVLVGTIGVVLAAPVTVTVMVLVQRLYVRDALGDPEPGRLVERP
jgi:hypothetical protein